MDKNKQKKLVREQASSAVSAGMKAGIARTQNPPEKYIPGAGQNLPENRVRPLPTPRPPELRDIPTQKLIPKTRFGDTLPAMRPLDRGARPMPRTGTPPKEGALERIGKKGDSFVNKVVDSAKGAIKADKDFVRGFGKTSGITAAADATKQAAKTVYNRAKEKISKVTPTSVGEAAGSAAKNIVKYTSPAWGVSQGIKAAKKLRNK
jgi:hypothetical protein